QGPASIVVSVIGGQGHIFGRGNQQIGPAVIRAVGLENIIAVATKSKLEALPHGVIVDTGDLALDKSLSGLRLVQTGYEDAVLVQWSGQ
ncbi:MAG: ATP-NAD kinase, partial [Proteobacteria bacterium]|nr:ATP-NAD kinase [Pseudomonadota bacterium]